MKDELLLKFVLGQVTEAEREQVMDWVSESEGRRNELNRITNIWVLSGLDAEVDEATKKREIGIVSRKVAQLHQRESRQIRLKWMKYAAVLLFAMGLSGLFGYFYSSNQFGESSYTEIIVPKGERSNILLPDGSSVQLNSGSSLKFESSFRKKDRKVQLRGEAYFDVEHDESRPFIVEARDMQLEVLGTSFNVCSYEEDSLVYTYLETGKVKVKFGPGQSVLMKPSQVLEYSPEKQAYRKIEVKDSYMADWTRGILSIRGETIGDLAHRLERRYNIRIFFGDDGVRTHLYSGSIRDQDLITVLEALKYTSSLNYSRNGNIVTLSSK